MPHRAGNTRYFFLRLMLKFPYLFLCNQKQRHLLYTRADVFTLNREIDLCMSVDAQIYSTTLLIWQLSFFFQKGEALYLCARSVISYNCPSKSMFHQQEWIYSVNTEQQIDPKCSEKQNSLCVKREKNQQDATIRYLLSTSVSTCFGHHYAHLQENKDRVTAYGVLLLVGSGYGALRCRMRAVLASYNAVPHNHYQPHPAEPAQYTVCINTVFVLLKMGVMMPETC